MDIFESLNSVLVDLFNDILNIEERGLRHSSFFYFSLVDRREFPITLSVV